MTALNPPRSAESAIVASRNGRGVAFGRLIARHTYLFTLLLLIFVVIVNRLVQSSLFELRPLNGYLRNFLPLMLVAAGQTIVILGGGIDLSVGAIVTLGNAALAGFLLTPDSTPGQVLIAIVGLSAIGMICGWLNGMCISYLRLQPIVTTYAASFVYGGIALLVLPRPSGKLPDYLLLLYKSTPGNIPFVLFVMILLAAIWLILRSTRYGQYLLAVGDKAEAAYSTGIPVNRIRFSVYVLSGLFSALAALALTMNSGTGSPRIGDAMTLTSIVAVVLGGTRLSGGRGGVIGSLLGVVILSAITNIISFANVPSWSQTLVNALIIFSALAIPGLFRLIRSMRSARQ